MTRTVLTIILAAMSTATVQAQAFGLRVLVPIVINHEIPGAFGSRWTSSVTIHNMGDTAVRRCDGISIVNPSYLPGTTRTMELDATLIGQVGKFLCITGSPDEVMLKLRVQDISRQALTWGTEIPVVREQDIETDTLALVNMPTDERFRQTLRIYDWDGNFGEAFRLRILDRDGAVLVEDILTPLPPPTPPYSPGDAPGYTEIPWITGRYPQLTSEESVTLHISPVNSGVRFWAFLSVTNNETQHVTTITPD